MALVISKAAKLKPEICLGQALSEFESLINHEQKIQLHSFSSEIPDATAVMKLTSEIDRKNSNRRSRCIGSRLTNILESVQQFTTVIDVSIGSSQSNIAALTWGGVKLALLAANNFSSYFDKLSNLFMKIGRTCPRFSELAMLYPTKAITCSNRHSLAQAATSLLKPFEVEFGSFQKNLDSLGLEISEEVSLASKRAQIKESKSQELERRKNDSYRSLGLKFRHRTDQELGEAHQWRERKM
ncbi:hypothetical protein MMC12_007471, partial [Toensbergia leucococca]|nr:hypothetical protein [Toensbergia leucococca]